MKIAKIILSIVTMLFALLGLLKVISFDIANPIMFLALATLLVLRSIEYKKSRENSSFILTVITAVFLYVVVIYNVFYSIIDIRIHEITHLIFMKIFSKEKINISIKFPTISVGSNAKYSKKQFSIIALAPVIILGIILILLILFSSKDYTFLWSILLTLNFAGSGEDFLQFLKISKYPTNTYFQDTSNETIVFQ